MQDPTPQNPHCRILIAEDHTMLLDSFTFYLRYRGYEVYPAQNGEKALEIMERCSREGTPVHMLITDIDMPIVNGEELIAMIRAVDEQFPILAMTNSIDPGEIHHLERFGRIAFIDKPFRLTTLQMRVEQLMKAEDAPGFGAAHHSTNLDKQHHFNRRPNEKAE